MSRVPSRAPERLVVAGFGMVGYKLVERLAALDALWRYDVTVVGEEPHPAYDRVRLTEWLDHRDTDRLALARPGWGDALGIRVVTGARVASIDRERRLVRAAGGAEIGYDRLVLATGSAPFVPPIDDPRNAADLDRIDVRACVTCHTEHRPGITAPMGVTLPADFCAPCHETVADDRPTHRGLSIDTCASGGCHNYHDNRALYEDFLVEHGDGGPDTFAGALPPRETWVSWDAAERAPLTVADAAAPASATGDRALIDAWAGSAHAAAGVGCADCHRPAGAACTDDPASQPFYGTETLGGVDYFTAVYPDVAVAEACVNCHNAHPDSARDDFAVGDTMGGVVIRIPVG